MIQNNLYPQDPILIVDDDAGSIEAVKSNLAFNHINNIKGCTDSRKCLDILKNEKVSIILLDLNMPFLSGDELLPQIKEQFPEISVLVVTGINDTNMAVECIKKGAYDYITKPVDNNRLLTSINNAIKNNQLIQENAKLNKNFLGNKLENPELFKKIITKNKEILSIFNYIEAVSCSTEPVLIQGESGVGKELFAEVIHNSSKVQGELVSVNIAGLDEATFSDTLFGHKKGAFTGADTDKNGLIEQANHGTLFLDEIGDLALSSQVKLLRLLQEKEYYPLGANIPNYSNVRIIAATNKNLNELQQEGTFRKDFYYRISTHKISIPPLRDRIEDIPELLNFYINEAATKFDKKKPTYPKELVDLLKMYDFPGNIREFRSIIFDAVSQFKSGILSMEVIKQHININKQVEQTGSKGILFADVQHLPTIKECTDALVKEALDRSQNNQTLAAQVLGITRQALNKRLKD